MIIEAETLNPSVNFYFTITVTLKGEDNNLFLSSSTITLSADNGNEILGNPSMTTSTGSAILSVYFSSVGTKIITATCSGISNTKTILVVNEVLKIISINPIVIYMQPLTSTDVFSITVGVYDCTSSNLETIQNYIINLSLTGSGVLYGGSPLTTSGGTVDFTGLRILSAGSISIIVSSDNIASISSSVMTIANYVYTIEVTSNNPSPSANFIFTITATLEGEDHNLYTGTAIVLISTSPANNGLGISGSSSITTTNGIATFNVYFNSFGSKTITATCNSITGTLTLTILEQALKITNINPTVINI